MILMPPINQASFREAGQFTAKGNQRQAQIPCDTGAVQIYLQTGWLDSLGQTPFYPKWLLIPMDSPQTRT